MFGLPLGGARAAATHRKSSPQKQPAKAREADGGEKPPTPHKKSRGRRRRTPLSPVERGRASKESARQGRECDEGAPPPCRARCSPAPAWGSLGGWVGGRSEYKKACEADTTQQRAYGHQPTARSVLRVCLPIGRLGGWAEGAINKPAKQTPPNKRPNGHTPSRHPAPALLSCPLQIHLFFLDCDANLRLTNKSG